MNTLTLNRPTSRTERLKLKNELNKVLNSHPIKIWFELITNIPVLAKSIIWKILVEDGYINVIYSQDIAGPSIETLKQNMISSETISGNNITIKEKPDSSSIYGSGLTTIGDYCEEQTILSYPLNSESYSYNLLSDDEDAIEIPNDDSIGFAQIMKIPYTPRMGGYTRFIETLREMISEIDSENILKGRVHKFDVSGLPTKTDDIELSKPIQPKKIEWVDENGTTQITPKYYGLEDDHGNIITKLKIESVGSNDKDTNVTLNITGIGKRTSDFKLKGFDGDKPVLIVYYEGTNQIAFIITLRKGSGEISLNNVIVTATIDKSEVALFLTSADKMTGISPTFRNSLFDKIRPYILRTYPDTNLVEKMTQLYTESIIVNDKGGKASANLFRENIGLAPMNKMTPAERSKIVKLETSKDSDRYDIRIYMIWLTNNKLTAKTPYWIGEVKRNDYNRNDRNQLYAYAVKNREMVMGVAISNKITPKSHKSFTDDAGIIEKTERLNDVSFKIIDVDDYGFNDDSVFREYLKLAQDATEN